MNPTPNDSRRDVDRTEAPVRTASPTTSNAVSPPGAKDGQSLSVAGAHGASVTKQDPAIRTPARDPSDRSDDAHPSPSSASSGSRSSRSAGEDGTPEAIRCLIASIETIVREAPRGTAAKLDGVTELLGKARNALAHRDGSANLAPGSVRPEARSGSPAPLPSGGEPVNGSLDRTARPSRSEDAQTPGNRSTPTLL